MSGLDTAIFLLIYNAWGGALTPLALVLTTIGGGWAMIGVIPLFVMPRWRPFAASLVGACIASAGLVFVIKHAVVRARPCNSLDGVHALCATPVDPSFPSGHSCGSFTLAAFVVAVLWSSQHMPFAEMSRGRRIGLTALFLGSALAIAWSRVYLGVHFPGDVTVGGTLGAATGVLVARIYVDKTRDRPELV